MAKLKKPFLFALCLLPIAIVTGIFVGFYQLDTLSDEMIAQVIGQIGSEELFIVLAAVQTALYALIFGFFGHILANKVGLWKPLRLEKKPLILTLLVSVVGGIVLSLDHWLFGSVYGAIQEANIAGLTFPGLMTAVLYGGIIEELMLRLFFLSLVAWVLWKVFCRKCTTENIPTGVFVAANIIAALLFAALHLPQTIALYGELSPLLLLRCFLFNGCFGLLFGWLYRKYGLAYSVISHAVCHIVCRLIWVLFI